VIEAPGPAAREDHTWTVDSGGEVAYLFGGRDGATVFGDLWAFDLAVDRWQQLSPPASPPPRFGHEAVWIDGVGLVVFAGQSGSTFYNDLWAFDPDQQVWQRLPAIGDTPVPRYGSCSAVGSDGRLWISHGFTSDGTRYFDTVAYDFGTDVWTDRTPAGNHPVERCLHACWWTDDGQLTLYAGQTTGTPALGDRWLLDDDGWVELDNPAPPPRNLYAAARVAGASLVFGGQGLDGSVLGDLWRLDDSGADVELAPLGAAPPSRAGGAMIADGDRARILLFGGRTESEALGDMWELTVPNLAAS
jgi:N-acetylneuraminic acid mutarotase